MVYPVNEIFYSLLGEGFWVGTPAVFIRLSGCNLKCPWCDTTHIPHTMMTPKRIVEEAFQAKADWLPADITRILIVLTGGEPTIHNLQALGQELKGCCILMETNGTASPAKMNRLRQDFLSWLTISPKLTIDEHCQEYFDNPEWKGDELKVVLDPKIPQDVLKGLPQRLGDRFRHYYIQPCSSDNRAAVEFVKENPQWRLSIQMQKVLDIR